MNPPAQEQAKMRHGECSAIQQRRSNMRRLATIALSALALGWVASAPGAARAQDYPSRPIKLILPQPPGGAVDLIARTLGERLAEQMKQPVIVENKLGANGGLAAGDVARSAPDGYTLLVAVDTNLVVNPLSIPVCHTIRSATLRPSACSPKSR
jgi:tripartite-type tricarboxylate transporter receptor subunit TctC